jgi:hypothetical protein
MSDHPITPPPELVQQWIGEFFGCKVSGELASSEQFLANRAAQWGADQELEACCEEMKSLPNPLGIPFGEMASNALRAARRPKPPSLKEQALDELCISFDRGYLKKEAADTIRRALEQLDD